MASEAINILQPLVVIMGPTASGKTSAAISIAKRLGGEIICADSRTVYIGMDIGTAKPTTSERNEVPHWGLDLINPNEQYSVAEFKTYTDKKITEIRGRGHVPLLVGGTGLYIDSVIFDYKFGQPVDETLRTKLQQMSLDELYKYCQKNSIAIPENYKNKRYVIRAIENNGVINNKSTEPVYDAIVVGITTYKDNLMNRIISRLDKMISDGVINEAKNLGDDFGWEKDSMKSGIYGLAHQYLEGKITIDELKNRCAILDWHLAKRQMTWMKRNKFTQWMPLSGVEKYITDQLAMARQS
jgi:tRNA dimethylallyltransferase